ncbi:methionyl-tRNA synthetase [Methylacidimicrobium cyclopophantes]|uniref:methionine--tRNA ligase n=1 Tax=Methylacidimicrobium cyclopophantes TaxID=1041766 RepID=A0A5E6M9S8_9BACT|nr:class I tRNA ligase family protein [Methylacidimicrobium cyclopophantes]VVM06155.1 methionyl-tRNA synthetase [Methylacidimicrobium cyclopophantes]
MGERFFLTTAIDYVNGSPHLGHAYEKTLADALARYHRLCGRSVFFLSGVDEHGQKVQQSARALGLDPKDFCDRQSELFRALWARLDISFDRFARTTDPLHKEAVRRSLEELRRKELLRFEEHEGFYSLRQEQFVTEKERVDGRWPEIFGEVVPMREPNYFFLLSRFGERIRREIEARPDWIIPEFRRNELLAALRRPLQELCISRPRSRLAWGIPLPFDEEYVTYVWFDALLNYVSFAESADGGSWWPADLQIIGKDILVPAHGVYWPAILDALELPLPRRLLVHGWWLNRGAKMSKSTGNAIDPVPYLERYGSEALRYFLLREMTLGNDADFSDEKFLQRYRSDLANDLGNLAHRTLSMIVRYRGGRVPGWTEAEAGEAEGELAAAFDERAYREAFDQGDTSSGLAVAWTLIGRANRYIDQAAPWRLARSPDSGKRLDVVFAALAETLRRIAISIEPALPRSSRKLLTQLGIAERPLLARCSFAPPRESYPIGAPEPLFPRIEE